MFKKTKIVDCFYSSLFLFFIKSCNILKRLNIDLNYKPFDKFNTTCSQTFDNCVFAVFNSNSFEESIKTVLSYGGDTDTNACIVGSMAEALYGIDRKLIKQANNYIPDDFVKILDKAYRNIEDFER